MSDAHAPTPSITDVLPLYGLHAATVLRFLQARVPPGVAADDLAQEVWMKIGRRLATGGPITGENLRAFVLSVARNVLYDSARSKKNRPATTLEDDPAARIRAPLDGLIAAEEAARIRDCMARLPEGGGDLIVRKASGEKPGQIAKELGLPADTVSKRLYRAKQALAECLERKRGDS